MLKQIIKNKKKARRNKKRNRNKKKKNSKRRERIVGRHAPRVWVTWTLKTN